MAVKKSTTTKPRYDAELQMQRMLLSKCLERTHEAPKRWLEHGIDELLTRDATGRRAQVVALSEQFGEPAVRRAVRRKAADLRKQLSALQAI